MTEQEYMQKRVDNQIKWYSNKSSQNKKLYHRANSLVIICAALIPFASGFLKPDTGWLNYVVAGLGMLTAILTGLSALYKYQEKWTEYRTTCESLKHEKIMYETNTGPYETVEDKFKEFVFRVEQLISQENSKWNQYSSQ